MDAGAAPKGRFGRLKTSAAKRIKRFVRTLREWAGTLFLGVLFIAIGVVLLERYHASSSLIAKLAGLFISELGFAFLIAAIIFAMIEEWSAREHCKTAIGHLYGVRPVGHFFKKIEEYVLEQHYYRSKVIVEYDFQKKIGEHILVCYSVQYEVFNKCTHDDVEGLAITGGLSKRPLHVGPTEWDNMLGVHRVVVDGVELSRDDLVIEDDDEKRTQSYRVKERKDLAFNASATIETSHFMIKHDHDATAWAATVPSLCAELRLKWSPEIALKFVAEAIHPESQRLSRDTAPNSLILTLDEPFLIGHGFHFWWSPLPAPETATAAAGGADAGRTAV